MTNSATFITPDARNEETGEDLGDLLFEVPPGDKRGACTIGQRISRHFSITTFLALILSSCGLLERRDGLFECDYSGYGNPPVVYRYYRNSKILAMINQGERVINNKYSVEEVDEKVLWKQGESVSVSLNLQTMELKETAFIWDKPQTTRAMCSWK